MNEIVARLFDNIADLRGMVRELEAMGFSHDQISVVSGHADDAARAAAGVGLAGVRGGILSALRPTSLPGLRPVVAAGWLASDSAISLAEALKRAGADERDAEVYGEGVRRGGALLSVHVGDCDQALVQAAMRRFGGVDAATRGPVFRASGWTGH